jgi:uncharacterized protein YjcR
MKDEYFTMRTRDFCNKYKVWVTQIKTVFWLKRNRWQPEKEKKEDPHFWIVRKSIEAAHRPNDDDDYYANIFHYRKDEYTGSYRH